MWLAIEASTYTASIALIRDGHSCLERTLEMRGAREERLMPAVVECVEECGGWGEVSRVFSAAGPGAFTPLRIAASIAKGLAWGRGIELWSGSSLALRAVAPSLPYGRVTVTADALRGEVFAQDFDRQPDGTLTPDGPWRLLPLEVARASAIDGGHWCDPSAGDGPRAWHVPLLDRSGLISRVDLAGWEPDYGRLAEAQVVWEARHGRPLPRAGT